MRTSCINSPKNEPLIIIHKWQLEFTNGNECAAALLSFFIYWHDYKLNQSQKARQANDIALRHGDERYQDETLMQWHNEKELENGVLVFKRKTIRNAIGILETLGVLDVMSNPNPKYSFDKTKYFTLKTDIIISWLEDRERRGKIAASSGKNTSPSSKKAPLSGKIADSSYNETTTEITTEITLKMEQPPCNPVQTGLCEVISNVPKDGWKSSMEALAKVCGMELRSDTAGRLGVELKKIWDSPSKPTPGLIIQMYATGNIPRSWWYRCYWKGKKGEAPKPNDVSETWGVWPTAPDAKKITAVDEYVEEQVANGNWGPEDIAAYASVE